MAARQASVKYASRTAVHGSNAYDLKQAAAAQAIPQSAPVYAPEHEVRPAPERQARPSAKPASKTQRYYGVSLFAVTGFVLVAVMMVFVVLAQIKFTEISDETAQLKTQLSALSETERKLQIDYEAAFDINEIEDYATNVLGMAKPVESQIGTVTAAAQDKAVVISAGQSGEGESLTTFLSSLTAYFKQAA